MGGGLSKKKLKAKREDGNSSPALHPDLLGCEASSRLTIPERHYVVNREPAPLFSQSSSKLKVVVDSSDLEEAKRILNEQEKELVRLRRLQMAKDRELELLKQQAVSRKLAAVASPDLVMKERKVIVGDKVADDQSAEVTIVHKEDEVRDMIWEVCLDNVLFSDLELPYKLALTDPFAPIEVDAGQNVVTQGEIGDLFYIVETGHLRVFVKSREDTACLDDTSPDNMTQFQVHSTLGKYVQFLGPHSSFGELALMYETPRAATVYAVTNCTLWAIKRDDCRAVLKDIQQGQMISRINFLRNVHIGDNDQKVVLGSLLTEHELNRLASALETETVPASEIIIRQGQPGNHFYIIESGKVSVHKNPANSGRRASVVADCNCVATIEAGGYFGELALINEDVRAASVKAVTDCTLLTLSRIDFVAHLGPFSERLAEAHDLEEVSCKDRCSNLEDNSGAPTRYCNEMDSPDAEDSQVDIKDLVVLGTLGQGSFGTVRLVKHSSTGKLFACKCQPKYKIIRLKLQEYVATECSILNMCRSPFILRLHHALQTNRFVYLVVEFLAGGALYSHLQKLVCFAEPMMRFYVSQVVLALTCLHEHSVVYRDLKPENLVLDARGYIKVIDFGLSKVLNAWKVRLPVLSFSFCVTRFLLCTDVDNVRYA